MAWTNRYQQCIYSYSKFAREKEYDVLFITADQDMAFHAQNAEIPVEILTLPFDVPSDADITPWQTTNLLYDLAITFGVIELPEAHVTLFGEWKGKTSSDYTNENLKLTIDQGARIEEALMRDLKIVKAIASS